MRRAAKVDGNHAEIVKALRQAHCRVLSLAAVGKGCPDLLVLFRSSLFLVEVKNMQSGHGNERTEGQKKFHEQWPVIVAETVEKAIAEIVRRGE